MKGAATTTEPLWAITLHRPWPYAILRLGKPIENRSWRPPPALIGQRVAIHAGRVWDQRGLEFIRGLGHECPDDGPEHPQGVVGTVRLTGWVEESSSPWYMGDVGFTLADPLELQRPLACRGHQKFWRVPPNVALEIR